MREDTFQALISAIDHLQVGLTITDLNSKIIYTNEAEARMHGYSVGELVGRDARIFAPRDIWKMLTPGKMQTKKSWRIETLNIRRDGTIFPLQITSGIFTGKDGRPLGIISVSEDITERKTAQSDFYDPLTKLPNQPLFMDRLGRALKRIKRRHDYLFALLYLDLDKFKEVNDSLGQVTGDQLLISCARRLEGCIRFGDTVARLGGDHFCILLDDINDIVEATFVAVRIHKQINLPFPLGTHEVTMTTSIGIAEGASSYDRPEEIVRDAEKAAKRSKILGRGHFEVYDRGASAVSEFSPMESDLRAAVQQQRLVLHYQPVVSLETGRIVTFEALVRWMHPERGLVYPDDFLPLAEETGWIVPIGEWVLRTALAQNSQWRTGGLPPLKISVNVSARQLDQKDLPGLIANLLEQIGLPPDSLELEVAERVIAGKSDRIIRNLQEIKRIGVNLALDDFGTGHASLGYLERFSIKTLKMDRSFVRDLTADPKDDAIVTSLIQLAHQLQMQVVAEGVETEDQLQFLRWHHCDEMQGYLVSKPLPADKAAAFLLAEKTEELKGPQV